MAKVPEIVDAQYHMETAISPITDDIVTAASGRKWWTDERVLRRAEKFTTDYRIRLESYDDPMFAFCERPVITPAMEKNTEWSMVGKAKCMGEIEREYRRMAEATAEIDKCRLQQRLYDRAAAETERRFGLSADRRMYFKISNLTNTFRFDFTFFVL